jgi:hypothetical protein
MDHVWTHRLVAPREKLVQKKIAITRENLCELAFAIRRIADAAAFAMLCGFRI